MAHRDQTYIGLKKSIIEAKKKAAIATKSPLPDTRPNSYIDKEAEFMADAILECLTQANFSITKLKAPVIIEKLVTSEQFVNIELETLLGEYQPVLKLLHKIGDPLGVGKLIDKLEGQIEKAVTPLLQGGAKMVGLDLKKENPDSLVEQNNFLESEGYVYIGEDPITSEEFNVDDVDGQQDHTEVVLFKEDAEKLK